MNSYMKEHLDRVDEEDNVISRVLRKDAHEKGFLHRVIHILILNSDGDLLMQKRALKTDTVPGLWTSSVSGHVESGENYEQAAKKELGEELGIKSDLEYIGKITNVSENMKIKHTIGIFTSVHEGPFKINPEEVEKIEFVKIGKLKREIRLYKRKVTPDFYVVFKEFCRIKEL